MNNQELIDQILKQTDEVVILPVRKAGNTTRQIDAEIQGLFLTGEALIRDHAIMHGFKYNYSHMAHLHHCEMFVSRLHHLNIPIAAGSHMKQFTHAKMLNNQVLLKWDPK